MRRLKRWQRIVYTIVIALVALGMVALSFA